jgi:hypothetical protein
MDLKPVLESQFFTLSVGVALGFLSSVGGTWLADRRKFKRERQQAASLFGGELQGILYVMIDRKYLEGMQQTVQYMEETRELKPFHVSVNQNFFHAFHKYLDKAALLPVPIPGQISLIYSLIFSLLEDVNELRVARGAESARRPAIRKVPLASKANGYVRDFDR